MENKTGNFSLLVLAVLIAGVLFVSGCTALGGSSTPAATPNGSPPGAVQNQQPQGTANAQQGSNPSPPGGYGNRSGFGNATPAQRQQMYAAMMQQATAACNGLSAGAQCTIQSQRGSRAGICQEQNSTLLCIPQTGGYNRTAASSG